MANFTMLYKGAHLSFTAYVRKACEQGLKSAVIASGADVAWES